MTLRHYPVVLPSLCFFPATAFAMFREDVTLSPSPATEEYATGALLEIATPSVVEEAVSVQTQAPETAVATDAENTSKPLSRIDFTATIVRALYSEGAIDRCYWDIASTLPPEFTLVFSDVPTTHPLAKDVCMAMRNGLIRGYGDGSFRPDQPITFAEATKIVSRAYALAPYADAMIHDPWYHPYLASLSDRHSIPMEISRMDQLVTASSLDTMMTRIEQDITWEPSRELKDLFPIPVQTKTLPLHGIAPASGSTSSLSSAGSSSSRRKYFWESL